MTRDNRNEFHNMHRAFQQSQEQTRAFAIRTAASNLAETLCALELAGLIISMIISIFAGIIMIT